MCVQQRGPSTLFFLLTSDGFERGVRAGLSYPSAKYSQGVCTDHEVDGCCQQTREARYSDLLLYPTLYQILASALLCILLGFVFLTSSLNELPVHCYSSEQ